MRKISDRLRDAVGNDEMLRRARAQRAFRHWADIVGGPLATRSCPDRYTNGTVWVAVQNATWAQEMRMMKDTILRRLREIANEPDLFVDVRFGVRPLHIQAEEPEEVIPWDQPSGRSIQEMAKHRLRNWPDDEERA